MTKIEQNKEKWTTSLPAGSIASLIKWLCCVLTLSSTPVHAMDYELKFGGWSKHTKSFEKDTYVYNEEHNGIGIEFLAPSDSEWQPVLGVWTMSDSFDERMFQAGAGFRYTPDLFDGRVSGQLTAVIERRGIHKVSTTTGKSDGIYMTTRLMPIPYINITPFPKVGLGFDFIYVPRLSDVDVETYFIRGSLRTSALTRLSKL